VGHPLVLDIEGMLLGIVALRAGKKIEYDAAAMRVVNDSAANQYFGREPRTGWSTGNR